MRHLETKKHGDGVDENERGWWRGRGGAGGEVELSIMPYYYFTQWPPLFLYKLEPVELFSVQAVEHRTWSGKSATFPEKRSENFNLIADSASIVSFHQVTRLPPLSSVATAAFASWVVPHVPPAEQSWTWEAC